MEGALCLTDRGLFQMGMKLMLALARNTYWW